MTQIDHTMEIRHHIVELGNQKDEAKKKHAELLKAAGDMQVIIQQMEKTITALSKMK